MNVELWRLIKDWLPTAGWEILEVKEPYTNSNNDELPAFIMLNVERFKHARGPNQDHPFDKICMIRDKEVYFFDKGMWDFTLKASDPDFFTKLDQNLTTLFHEAEWWKHKVGQAWSGHKEKIWPK